MDYRLKAELGGFLQGITASGGSVVMVTMMWNLLQNTLIGL